MTKKRKQKDSSSMTELGVMKKGFVDIDSIIHSNAEFFDRLVELIPAKFYLPSDESKPWFQGLSKAAKASLKKQTKKNLKEARRQRYDVDKEQVSTLDLLQQQTKENEAAENSEKTATYEELREKLRKKIESLKGNRGENKLDGKKVKNDGRKRKRDSESGVGEKGDAVTKGDGDEEENIEYGKVKLGDENEALTRNKKKKKLSKEKELQKAKMLQEAKKENPYVAKRESWKAAASRASGIKVHDDARLIKDSMRREKRKKAKSAEKWKGRVETQENKQKERQDKRKQNIAARVNDKKMRKIAKREKKLLRPGFEGRKEDYITNE